MSTQAISLIDQMLARIDEVSADQTRIYCLSSTLRNQLEDRLDAGSMEDPDDYSNYFIADQLAQRLAEDTELPHLRTQLKSLKEMMGAGGKH